MGLRGQDYEHDRSSGITCGERHRDMSSELGTLGTNSQRRLHARHDSERDPEHEKRRSATTANAVRRACQRTKPRTWRVIQDYLQRATPRHEQRSGIASDDDIMPGVMALRRARLVVQDHLRRIYCLSPRAYLYTSVNRRCGHPLKTPYITRNLTGNTRRDASRNRGEKNYVACRVRQGVPKSGSRHRMWKEPVRDPEPPRRREVQPGGTGLSLRHGCGKASAG